MIAMLDRLPAAAIERAKSRAAGRSPVVSVMHRDTEGLIVATATCDGGCGSRAYNHGWHRVALHHDGYITCDCPTTAGLCYHAAAVLLHEGGELPPAPANAKPATRSPLEDWGDEPDENVPALPGRWTDAVTVHHPSGGVMRELAYQTPLRGWFVLRHHDSHQRRPAVREGDGWHVYLEDATR